jgi:YidC/Oxa1 family membrane protein insertase
MNKELMAFYQANGINPMGGCLPMFVQAPVFIVLYNVLRGLTRRLSDIGENAGWIVGRLSSDLPLSDAPSDPQVFFPDYVAADSQLFVDLSHQTEMVSWGVDLSRSAGEALSAGIIQALPYFLLILVVFGSSWIQQQQIRGRNKDSPVNPQQQMIMKVMPFFLPVISYSLDAALVLYFVISNLYRIGQQSYITRSLYGPHSHAPAVVLPESVEESPEKPKNKGGGTAGAKSSGGVKKPNDKTSDRGGQTGKGTSSTARRARTRAGELENQSQSASDSTDTQGKSGLFGRRKAKDTPADKGNSGRAGKKTTDRTNRPQAGRSGGGRTTPPGTQGARKARKKRRK